MKVQDTFKGSKKINLWSCIHAGQLICHNDYFSFLKYCAKFQYTTTFFTRTAECWLGTYQQHLDNTKPSSVLDNWTEFDKDLCFFFGNHNENRHTKNTLGDLNTTIWRDYSNHKFRPSVITLFLTKKCCQHFHPSRARENSWKVIPIHWKSLLIPTTRILWALCQESNWPDKKCSGRKPWADLTSKLISNQEGSAPNLVPCHKTQNFPWKRKESSHFSRYCNQKTWPWENFQRFEVEILGIPD